MVIYGIGPARIIAAAIEQGGDEKGIVWPAAIAPWPVHLVQLGRDDDETVAAAGRIYEQLAELGLEPLYDDRDAGPGEKLTDAELIGCPLRIAAARRALGEGEVEAEERRSGREHRLSLAGAAQSAAEIVGELE
jgi:prolyl-tRNA synthetase